MDPTTYQQVKEISRMTVRELRDRYVEIFGEETRSRNKAFLQKRLAWRIQALAEGDLSERARKRAEELARDADLRMRTPHAPVDTQKEEAAIRSTKSRLSTNRDRRLPQPGVILHRKYQDRDIVVQVLEDGFEFEGRRFKSLSAIARAATGFQWNGFIFFGLKPPVTTQKHQETIP